jgi:hypothetical protein
MPAARSPAFGGHRNARATHKPSTRNQKAPLEVAANRLYPATQFVSAKARSLSRRDNTAHLPSSSPTPRAHSSIGVVSLCAACRVSAASPTESRVSDGKPRESVREPCHPPTDADPPRRTRTADTHPTDHPRPRTAQRNAPDNVNPATAGTHPTHHRRPHAARAPVRVRFRRR